VLLAAAGEQDKENPRQLSMTPKRVSRWRKRFLAVGLPGLEKDAPRSGRKRRIGTRQIQRVVEMTAKTTPRYPLEHAYDGRGGWHQRSQCASHLA